MVEISVLLDFRRRYGLDDRAFDYLENCPADVQLKVVTNFDPKNKDDIDYSRKVTAYIRSLLRDHGGSVSNGAVDVDTRKRKFDDIASAEVSEFDIEAFRLKYPMDERAFEYLTTSPKVVQAQLLREFRPRHEGESDYSSLVTSMVKKARIANRDAPGSVNPVVLVARRYDTRTPSAEQLHAFRARFPMDERAWDFLTGASSETQERVLSDFKPRRPDDTDYSAAVTAFVRAIDGRGGSKVSHPTMVTLARLEAFRRRFPMDDRAYEFLTSSPTSVQLEALDNFQPKRPDADDFSRQITSYLKILHEGRLAQQGHHHGIQHPVSTHQSIPHSVRPGMPPDLREHRVGRAPAAHHGYNVHSSVAQGGGADTGWLRAFRNCFPMDERAFDYLSQSSKELQEAVMTEFKPRRVDDTDYSAAITGFVRSLKKAEESRPRGTRRNGTFNPSSLLEAFRRRYPMDERAWDFLVTSTAPVQRHVVEHFKPRYEGEKDYSRLITSFIKSNRS